MIERLVLNLRERDFEADVLTFGKNNSESGIYRAKGKIDFLKLLIKNALKYDVIYTFDLYTAGFWSWLIGKGWLKKKFVVRFAGDSAWESASNKGQTGDDLLVFQKKFYGLSVAWRKFLRKRILLGADKVVAVSEFMKKVAIEIGVSEGRIKVIYNSVDFVSFPDTYDFLPSFQKRHNLTGDQTILTVGRLVPWKGIDLLVKALAKINNKKLRLLVVGEGPDLLRLKNLVEEKQLIGQVEFVGKVPLNEVFEYYMAADVFILDSQYEGLSHVLLEVLLTGKPIIASRSGGNPEVIGDERNGLLVDYGNVEQLVVAIKRMLTEERWHSPEYKEKCRASLKKFNWHNVVEQTSKVIEELKP